MRWVSRQLQVAMSRCATDEVRREAVQNKLNKCHWLSEDKHLTFRGLGAVCCVSAQGLRQAEAEEARGTYKPRWYILLVTYYFRRP